MIEDYGSDDPVAKCRRLEAENRRLSGQLLELSRRKKEDSGELEDAKAEIERLRAWLKWVADQTEPKSPARVGIMCALYTDQAVQ